MRYVGRFAPSPTGPLHLGSLTVAVASFLHARRARGEWLVRIENIDPPREVPGAADQLLRTLEAFDLTWDRTVLYQSARGEAYRAAVEGLLRTGRAFRCSCSRSRILADNDAAGLRYPGTCRDAPAHEGPTAVRVRVETGTETFFDDGLQGSVRTRLDLTTGDYVVQRRDGLPAYHLAVVLDDAEQGITAVVRGIDLLDSTAAHLHLQSVLELPSPSYRHLPVIVNGSGQKLSKQTHAAAVSASECGPTACTVLRLLGLDVPQEAALERPAALWRWALERWQIDSLRGVRAIVDPSEASPAPGEPH